MWKDFTKRALHDLGWDLKRWNPAGCSHAQAIQRLRANGISLVLDVGANAGQFAMSLWNSGYEGCIVSFEPLSAAHAQLLKKSRRYRNWEVAPRAAIGDRDGDAEIQVASDSVSSSVLAMSNAMHNAIPALSYTATEKVPMRRLDTAAAAYLRGDSALFIKIDTQGFERCVLDGAPEALAQARGVQLELSLVPLYEHGAGCDELLRRLMGLGFDIWGIEPAFVHPENGRLLQIDATLFRR